MLSDAFWNKWGQSKYTVLYFYSDPIYNTIYKKELVPPACLFPLCNPCTVKTCRYSPP